MKVFHIIARYNKGGTARWLNVLIPRLERLGCNVTIFAGNVKNNEIEDENFIKLNGRRLDSLARQVSPLKDLSTIWKFRRILKVEKPDILNTHTAKAGLVGRVASIGLGIKVVHTFHGHTFYGYFKRPVTQIYLIIERVLSRFTDAYIVNGERVMGELISNKIANPLKFNLIYPGIESFDLSSRTESRQFLHINENEFVVGWLARFAKVKRPDRLIEISKKLPYITFAVGGVGELKYLFVTNKLPKNVKYLGWIDPKLFWPACDLALLTSDNEAAPIALIEAAYAGIPIVAEDVGSVSEVFEDGSGGILVHNLEERIAAIEKLALNREAVKIMGQNAQIYALKKFSIEKFIDEHLRVYNSI